MDATRCPWSANRDIQASARAFPVWTPFSLAIEQNSPMAPCAAVDRWSRARAGSERPACEEARISVVPFGTGDGETLGQALSRPCQRGESLALQHACVWPTGPGGSGSAPAIGRLSAQCSQQRRRRRQRTAADTLAWRGRASPRRYGAPLDGIHGISNIYRAAPAPGTRCSLLVRAHHAIASSASNSRRHGRRAGGRRWGSRLRCELRVVVAQMTLEAVGAGR